MTAILDNVYLKLALSAHGSILCSVENKTESELAIVHSPILYHSELYIFTSTGRPMPFVDRSLGKRFGQSELEGNRIELAADSITHLSHSRILLADDGTWGLTWGRMQYRGLVQGVYRFIATHKQTLPSSITGFEIPIKE